MIEKIELRGRKVMKVGNSLAVTLPSEFVAITNWREGDEVVFESSSPEEIKVLNLRLSMEKLKKEKSD